jgi:hypothetical protein
MIDIYNLNTENDFIDDNANNPLIFASKGELENYNNNLKQVDLRLFGDKTIIAQTIQLLSYIRHAIRNNLKIDMQLSIGNTIANPDFMFDANGIQVPDLVTQEKVQIN